MSKRIRLSMIPLTLFVAIGLCFVGCLPNRASIEGEIAAINDGSITIKTNSGEMMACYTDANTHYSMGGSPNGMPPENDASQDTASHAEGGKDETPPDKPESMEDKSSGEAPPDIPDNSNGKPESIDASSLKVGDKVAVEIESGNIATSITVQSAPPGSMDESSIEYKAAYTFDEDSSIENQSLESSGTDEETVLVDKAITVNLQNDSIARSSSDSTGGDNSSFYGVGAALLATDGVLDINKCSIATDAKGGAGVFSYGSGTVNVSDTSIITKQDASGGIHVAGGGTLNATNVKAETSGESSAAIRSDRGSGTMNVQGGTFTSNGTGSPAIYSTANINVSDAKLEATNSEAACIEGKNSISLKNCSLEGNQPQDSRNEITWNVILYQSMSGDSEQGNSTFKMDGGTLKANNGGMFYTTNTESTFVLRDVDIQYSNDNPFLLRCTGNSNKRGWGKTGENGADSNFTAIRQNLSGIVQWDSISKLDFYLTDKSVLEGSFEKDESVTTENADGNCNLYISENSKWIVSGDSALSTLSCNGTIEDESGKDVSIVDENGNILKKGDSRFKITVSSFDTNADMSGAASI